MAAGGEALLPPATYSITYTATNGASPVSPEYGPMSVTVACTGGVAPSYGPCQGVVCQNGGRCSGGTCTCVHPYTGTNCETSSDPCYGYDCNGNKGTCVVSNGAATCQCSSDLGYTGTRCDAPPVQELEAVCLNTCDGGNG